MKPATTSTRPAAPGALRTSLLALLAVLLCFGLSTTSLAAPSASGATSGGERAERGAAKDASGGGERREGRRAGMGQLIDELGLTETQRTTVSGIVEGQRDEMRALREQMREARRSEDREAFVELGEQMRALMDQTRKSIRAELTPEQLTTFDAQVEQMQTRARAMREQRGERGEGERQGRGQRRGPLADLDLTEAQEQAIGDAMRSSREAVRDLQEQLRTARESGDEEAMQALGQQLRDTMDQAAEAVRAELTPEQQTQYDANLNTAREQREQRRAERQASGGQASGGDGERRRSRGDDAPAE
ncbi:MAG: Spy/CpxP family protein refolding chaperone [Planctomycetota bacterium]